MILLKIVYHILKAERMYKVYVSPGMGLHWGQSVPRSRIHIPGHFPELAFVAAAADKYIFQMSVGFFGNILFVIMKLIQFE